MCCCICCLCIFVLYYNCSYDVAFTPSLHDNIIYIFFYASNEGSESAPMNDDFAMPV